MFLGVAKGMVALFAGSPQPAVSFLACVLQLHYFNDQSPKTTSLHNLPI